MPKLRAHLLPRIREELNLPSLTDSEIEDMVETQADGIVFKNGRLYSHLIFKVNYTTYDVRRAQDISNPTTSHRDIMGISHEGTDMPTEHPFWYARILGIFHVNIIYTGPQMVDYRPRRMDILWVRHFEVLTPWSENWKQLDQARLLPVNEKDAFGFVDPANVLRGCHLPPNYAMGKVAPAGISANARNALDGDYKFYSINRWV